MMSGDESSTRRYGVPVLTGDACAPSDNTSLSAMNKNHLKLIVAAVASAYFFWCAYDPYQWHLIDGVNLVIHEAGHLIFRPLGEFMMLAGGSLFQVIMPALFVGYFVYHRKYYSAALVLFWVGESILNVSVYAGDALALQLSLLGGEDSVHDWNEMLTRLDLLQSTATIAGVIRSLGTLTIIAASVGAFVFAKEPERSSETVFY